MTANLKRKPEEDTDLLIENINPSLKAYIITSAHNSDLSVPDWLKSVVYMKETSGENEMNFWESILSWVKSAQR